MKEITAQELIKWKDEGKAFQLLDVREDWERSKFHIGGTHIPLSEILQRKDEISKENNVVIYCEKGIRSQIIIQRLEEMGYINLYNLVGGMKAWRIMDTE